MLELYKEIDSYPTHLASVLPSRFDNKHWYFAGHSAGANSAYIAAKELGKDKVKACILYDGAISLLTGDRVNSDVPLLTLSSTTAVKFLSNEIGTNVEDLRTKLHAG